MQELKNATASSTSKRQVLLKLGIKAAGGNYNTLKKAFAYFNINTSHFKGQSWSKGRRFGPRRPLSAYLSNKFPIKSHKLKIRLIKEGTFEHRCSNCNRTEWEGEPIPIELDHINGNHMDNSLTNLRILCPNCHAQTPTYRGKNKGNHF